jgi:predicted transcriptional regulator
MMWNGLPVIRREFAESMINDFGLSQKEAAEKLGITPAAVCQYVSRKRGRIEISDKVVLKEIKISAESIIEANGKSVLSETCRICKILRESKDYDLFCQSCDD